MITHIHTSAWPFENNRHTARNQVSNKVQCM